MCIEVNDCRRCFLIDNRSWWLKRFTSSPPTERRWLRRRRPPPPPLLVALASTRSSSRCACAATSSSASSCSAASSSWSPSSSPSIPSVSRHVVCGLGDNCKPWSTFAACVYVFANNRSPSPELHFRLPAGLVTGWVYRWTRLPTLRQRRRLYAGTCIRTLRFKVSW